MAEVIPGQPWTSDVPDDLSAAVDAFNDGQEDSELFDDDDLAALTFSHRTVDDVDATAADRSLIDYTCQFGNRTLLVPSSLPVGAEVIVALTKVGTDKTLNISFQGVKYGSSSASATSLLLRVPTTIWLRRMATHWVAVSDYVSPSAAATVGSDLWMRENVLRVVLTDPEYGRGGDGNSGGAAIEGTGMWPNGVTGTYEMLTVNTDQIYPGAVDSFSMTYGPRKITVSIADRDADTGQFNLNAMVVTNV